MSSRSSRSGPAVVALCALFLGALALGCNNADAGSQPAPSARPASTTSAIQPEETITAQKIERPEFDGKKAWAHLLKQCEFGPRPVGSDAHRNTLEYLVGEMRKCADSVVEQKFTYRGLPLTNVIGVFNPAAKRQILLCGHWDTRPTADEELDAANRRKPIVGASDGASETAVLLELARIFKEKKPDVGVVIVLLDGEDYGSFERDEGVLLGAKYFAKNHSDYKPEWGVLLDMVGDKDLNIVRETNSQQSAPALNNRVFRLAKEMGYGKELNGEASPITITDDHLPIIASGIPMIDLIDFDYGSWHRLSDTPESCSPRSLKVIGEVMAELVYRERGK